MKKKTKNAFQDNIDLHTLKESEARFRSIVLWSPDAIIVTDAKGKILYMNPAGEGVFNRKLESFIGKDFGLSLVNGESTEIDIFRPGKDPGVGDMHVVETEWLGEKAHLITIRDITGRKRAAEALSDSEMKFTSIFDHATDGIILVDIETKKFCDANLVMCDMLAYSLDEIKKMGIMDIHPQENLPYVLDQFEKQAKGEIVLAKDIPVKRKDGSVFYADISSGSIELAGKNYLMGIFRDITLRKQAEQRLWENEEKYRSIVENSSDEIFMLDKDYKFLSVNKTVADITGKSFQEMIGMSIFEVFPESVAAQFSKNIKDVFDNGKSVVFDEKIIIKGGEIYQSTSLNPV